MNNYAFVEGKKIKSAKFYWDLRFSLKNGTKPEKIKKTLFILFWNAKMNYYSTTSNYNGSKKK